MYYRNLIMTTTGCASEEAGAVEEMMRDTCPTLDGLSSERFKAEAVGCLADLRDAGLLSAGDLYLYETGEYVRPATKGERDASDDAMRYGHAGAFRAEDGVVYYVMPTGRP